MAWDGVAWTPVDLDGEGLVTDVPGRAADDVWAISGRSDRQLWHFDGEAWSVVGPARGPLAVTDDGAVWAQQPFGTLARFVDGVPTPVSSSFTARRLLADGNGVWLDADGGLVRVDVDGHCGVVVDDGVAGDATSTTAFATWVTFEPQGPRTFLAARVPGAPWRHWRLPAESWASLVVDEEVAWALVDVAPQGLLRDGAVWRFNGSDWSPLLDLAGAHPRGGATMGDGTLWLLSAVVEAPERTTVWRGDADGFVAVHTFDDLAATAIGAADGDVWVAGGTQLWRLRDGVWIRQPDTAGVTALQVSSRDEMWMVDDGALTRVTEAGRQVVCPIPLQGRRGIVDVGVTDDGLWVITTTRLYHWDGTTLREGPVVTDNEDGPRGILAGHIGGGAAWLSTRDGLLEVALEKGQTSVCEGSSPVPGEGEGEGEGDDGESGGCDCRSSSGDVVLLVFAALLARRRKP
jgi:MYXO-CTERM domain-containing protein